MCNTSILDTSRPLRHRSSRVVGAIPQKAAKSASDTLHTMHRTRPHPALACLISLIWLLAAVLPTWTHARMMEQGVVNVLTDLPSGAVCSTTAGSASDTSNDVPALQWDHCGNCLPHAGAAGLPPLPGLSTPELMPPAQDAPLLFLQAPRPLFAWATPAPRGPPQA